MSKSLDHVKLFNIYDIIIDILNEKNYLEKAFELEKKRVVTSSTKPSCAR